MVLTIILLALTASTLYKDYQQDAGTHKKAKIMHALVVGYVIVMYNSALALAGRLIRQFPELKAQMQVPIGALSSELNFGAILFHEVLCLILLFSVFSMVKRKLQALAIFRIVLLVSIPTDVINFYRGFVTEVPGFPTWVIMTIGLLSATIIDLGIYLLYGSRFMQAFFHGSVDPGPTPDFPNEAHGQADMGRPQL